ncbi:MAG: hypothetical protein M0020_07740 [Actinomycetota bacterium]|nr:hypothetical protein [Actinomycetota bacterium]
MVGALVAPVPLELLAFGLDASLRALGDTRLGDEPSSLDNGLLADYSGPISDPGELESQLLAIPWRVAHVLFVPALVSDLLVGQGKQVLRHRPCA